MRTVSGGENRGKFESKAAYSKLLVTAFRKASAYLAPDAVIYVRTGSRSETYDATTSALSLVFPHHRLVAEAAALRASNANASLRRP